MEAAGAPLPEAQGISNKEGSEVFRRILAGAEEPNILVSETDLSLLLLSARPQRYRLTTAVESPDIEERETTEAPTGRRLHPRPDLPTDYVPPEPPTEKVLAAIWSEVLGIDRVGVNDSFLELGGNSLVMVKVMEALEVRAGMKVNLRALFHQTLGQIASTCDAKVAEEEPAPAGRTGRSVLSALGRLVSPRDRRGRSRE